MAKKRKIAVRSKSKVNTSKKNNITGPYLAIVAIVAVVAIVLLVTLKDGDVKLCEDVNVGDDLVGEAARGYTNQVYGEVSGFDGDCEASVVSSCKGNTLKEAYFESCSNKKKEVITDCTAIKGYNQNKECLSTGFSYGCFEKCTPGNSAFKCEEKGGFIYFSNGVCNDDGVGYSGGGSTYNQEAYPNFNCQRIESYYKQIYSKK